MTIKDKAEAYDKLKVKAKQIYNKENDVLIMHTIEDLFPELKESEDERIRKELLEHCKNQAKPYIQTGNKCPQIQSWIAWLERQKSCEPFYNEEDERIRKTLIYHYQGDGCLCTNEYRIDYKEIRAWLEKKELKEI